MVSLPEFLIITLILGGGAAFLTGRALAQTWQPLRQLLFYGMLLSLVTRWAHFALFGGYLVDERLYLVDLAVIMVLAGSGHLWTRNRQMHEQYPWLMQRS